MATPTSSLGKAEPWLTKKELALELRVSTRTVERLRLPAMRVGGQNRYKLSEVQHALVEGEGLPDNVVPLRRTPDRGTQPDGDRNQEAPLERLPGAGRQALPMQRWLRGVDLVGESARFGSTIRAAS